MKQQQKYIYLQGILECQFEAVPEGKMYGPYDKPCYIHLQPRFRLSAQHRIYPEAPSVAKGKNTFESVLHDQSWLHHKEPVFVELEEGEDFIRKKAFGIWMLRRENQTLNMQHADGSWIPMPWQEFSDRHFINRPASRGLLQNVFKASGTKNLHGRIRGEAVIRIPDTTLQSDRVCAFVHPDDLTTCTNTLSSDQSIFCDTHRTLEPAGTETFRDRGGCLSGNGRLLDTLLLGPGSGTGQACWPSSAGCMGCSNGLWQMGCGLIGLLLALLFALWFIWCVMLGRCNEKKEEHTSTLQRDTVYVEVIKEIKDTLKVIQRDTIAIVDSTKEESFMMVALPNVQFYTDQAVLLPSSSRELATVAEYMNKHPEATAEIYGHTDSVGVDRHNMKLSQQRASAVRTFLMNLGVDGNRIAALGFGETQPKASNATPEGRLMNRRVEMKLTMPKKVSRTRTQLNPDSAQNLTQ